LSWLVPLSLMYNTQHKHPCPRRESNPLFQQGSGRRPCFRMRGHWDQLTCGLRQMYISSMLTQKWHITVLATNGQETAKGSSDKYFSQSNSRYTKSVVPCCTGIRI
jgi:hypothetical protein